jgi:protein-disulfide isomerase/uncharacterized membrane protein
MKLKIPFILVAVSFLLHLYLMNTHYDLRYGFEGTKSVCSINETLNCESVSLSPYSYFLGLPLATWGMAFHISFLFLFVLAFIQPPENIERRNSFYRFIKLFAVISVVASIIMATISLTMMSTYCIFCIALYLLSFLNLVVLGQQKQISFIPTRDDFMKIFKTGENGLIHVLVAFIAIPVIAFLAHDMSTRSFKQQTTYMIRDVLGEWERASEADFPAPLLKAGSDTPKMTIVEFADFQCIHCKNAAHSLHSFVNSRPNIQLQFFSFPLDGTCNPALTSGGNGKSCTLAKAVYCAEKQGKGWAAHNWIFDRFGTSANSEFEKMSKDLKLEHSALLDCIQSDEATQVITENAKLGEKVKVEGTPTVFVNGKKLVNGHILAILEELYSQLN